MNPDAIDSDPMHYAPFLRMLISQRVVVDGGQSAFGTGALRLPSGDSGLVLTQVNDNGDGGEPSAEPKARPVFPQRRLRRKTTLTGGGSAGDESRSVTPPQRRSKDVSDSAASSPSGLNPEADQQLPEPIRRRLDGGSAVPVVPVSLLIQRPGVARELCEVELEAPDRSSGEPGRYI